VGWFTVTDASYEFHVPTQEQNVVESEWAYPKNYEHNEPATGYLSHTKLIYDKSGFPGWYDINGDLPSDFIVTSVDKDTDTFTVDGGHGLVVGNKVLMSSNWDLPTPLLAGNYYWVIPAGFSATTFKLGYVENGDPINLDNVGSGVIRGTRPRGYTLSVIRHSAIFLFENLNITNLDTVTAAWLEIPWQLSNNEVCKGTLELTASITAYDADDTDNHWPNNDFGASFAPWEYPAEVNASHWSNDPQAAPNAPRTSSGGSISFLTVENNNPSATSGLYVTPSGGRAALGAMIEEVTSRPGWGADGTKRNLIIFLDESSVVTAPIPSPHGHVAGIVFGTPILRFRLG